MDCVLAKIGIGITIAGITDVPVTLAETFPTTIASFKSQTEAEYDEVSSHQAKPKQPPPPGPAAQDSAPELELVVVYPVTLMMYLIFRFSSLFLIICFFKNLGNCSAF